MLLLLRLQASPHLVQQKYQRHGEQDCADLALRGTIYTHRQIQLQKLPSLTDICVYMIYKIVTYLTVTKPLSPKERLVNG